MKPHTYCPFSTGLTNFVGMLTLALFLVAGVGCSSTPDTTDDPAPSAEEGVVDDEEQPVDDEVSIPTPVDEDVYEVVTANEDIPRGTNLSEDSVTTREVPRMYLPANPLLASDLSIYLGMPVSEDIPAGSLILSGNFRVSEVARVASARVPSGERGYILPGDATGGEHTPIRAGDRLDILGSISSGDDVITTTLLQNVTVISVGSSTPHENTGSGGQVAVALTPEEAELLTVVRDNGSLSVMFRNREDTQTFSYEPRSAHDVFEALNSVHQEAEEQTQDVAPCEPGEIRNDAGKCEQEVHITR